MAYDTLTQGNQITHPQTRRERHTKLHIHRETYTQTQADRNRYSQKLLFSLTISDRQREKRLVSQGVG